MHGLLLALNKTEVIILTNKRILSILVSLNILIFFFIFTNIILFIKNCLSCQFRFNVIVETKLMVKYLDVTVKTTMSFFEQVL